MALSSLRDFIRKVNELELIEVVRPEDIADASVLAVEGEELKRIVTGDLLFELEDARTDADDHTYGSLGEHIRGIEEGINELPNGWYVEDGNLYFTHDGNPIGDPVIGVVTGDGFVGMTVVLSTETYMVPTDYDGTNGDFVECYTDVQVYNGTMDITGRCTITAIGSEGITFRYDTESRRCNVTDLTTDVGYVEFTIVYKNASAQKRFTVTKAKRGQTGSPGIAGMDGRDGAAGAGVVSVEVRYGYSDSPGTMPDAWTISRPSVADGYYLWIRTTTTYEPQLMVPNTVTYSYSRQGTDGADGEDGVSTYVHLAYSNSQDGTQDFSTSDSEGKWYLGTYTDHNEEGSQTPGAYQWMRTKGEQGIQGPQGIPGVNGLDGRNQYLHIAYALNADGTQGFDAYDPSGKTHIGFYVDFVEIGSLNPAMYSWSQFRGIDGISVAAEVNYYLASDTNTGITTQTVGWSEQMQATTEAYPYLWNYRQLIDTNGNVINTTPPAIVGQYGVMWREF